MSDWCLYQVEGLLGDADSTDRWVAAAKSQTEVEAMGRFRTTSYAGVVAQWRVPDWLAFRYAAHWPAEVSATTLKEIANSVKESPGWEASQPFFVEPSIWRFLGSVLASLACSFVAWIIWVKLFDLVAPYRWQIAGSPGSLAAFLLVASIVLLPTFMLVSYRRPIALAGSFFGLYSVTIGLFIFASLLRW